MGIAEKLVSASIVGFMVAVLVLIVQLVSSTAAANYRADGTVQQGLNLTLPLLIGALAGAGAFVLQWNGRDRRRRPGSTKPA